MALLLRRGLEADRLSFTPEEGELIYVTDTKQIYVGDGVTPGGILVAGGGTEVEVIGGGDPSTTVWDSTVDGGDPSTTVFDSTIDGGTV
jgi:hypothetical protein